MEYIAAIVEINPETFIYGIFPDTISRDSIFANGGAGAQWTILITKTYSKPIPYSNPNTIGTLFRTSIRFILTLLRKTCFLHAYNASSRCLCNKKIPA